MSKKTTNIKIQYEAPSGDSKSAPSKNWQPENWKEVWEGIEKSRQSILAPIDEMTSKYIVLPKTPEEKNLRAYHSLVGLMLSAQTKDVVTGPTVRYLISEKNLSIETILKTEEKDLNQWISKVPYHNKKAKYIKNTTEMIHQKFGGQVPDNLPNLLSLPGVGLKMAHLLLQFNFGKVVGISADTHVHRISNWLQWVKSETKNANQTAAELQEWVPHDKWIKINPLLVGFGQTICKPVAPRCSECPIEHLCPYLGKNFRHSKSVAPSDIEQASTRSSKLSNIVSKTSNKRKRVIDDFMIETNIRIVENKRRK